MSVVFVLFNEVFVLNYTWMIQVFGDRELSKHIEHTLFSVNWVVGYTNGFVDILTLDAAQSTCENLTLCTLFKSFVVNNFDCLFGPSLLAVEDLNW